MRVVFVGRDRVIWKRLLLYIVTFGISRRIWLYRVNKEIDGHAALGTDHKMNIFLLALPFIGPFIVQCQTTKRLNNDLHSGAQLAYGPTWALCLLGLVPIVGNGFYLSWTQDRLNKYWAYERDNPQHGIDIDVGLEQDPKYLKELEKARLESYEAGSRFDRRKRERQDRWRARVAPLETISEERKQARATGGSTPLMPWRKPQLLDRRRLHVTCECEHTFELETDWREGVELTCPKCSRKEVIRPLVGTLERAT